MVSVHEKMIMIVHGDLITYRIVLDHEKNLLLLYSLPQNSERAMASACIQMAGQQFVYSWWIVHQLSPF